jgi:hypothetical protein
LLQTKDKNRIGLFLHHSLTLYELATTITATQIASKPSKTLSKEKQNKKPQE